MAEYTAVAAQTVQPGQDVIFTEQSVPGLRDLVRHRDGSGNFLFSGNVCGGCRCSRSIVYPVDFGANVAIPEGGTVGPVSLALVIDGSVIPASTMTVTPAAAGDFFNISRQIGVEVWRGCCETVAVRNIGTEPIVVTQATIDIDAPGR